MHNDELREGSREISIWHTKSLTGSNTVEKQRMEKEREREVRVVGYAYTCVPLVINVPTTVRHMRAHENRGELARMAKSYFQRGTAGFLRTKRLRLISADGDLSLFW